MSAELPPYVEGQPGLVIDEGFSLLDKTSFIDVSIFDEEGSIMFYTDFPRNVTPEEIAESLVLFAEELKKDPPSTMYMHDAEKIIDALLKEAKRVPGLKHR